MLSDPRLETSRSHPARHLALKLPPDVMPQDGFRQAGSVWCLHDERFSPCISPLAQNLKWWGATLADSMELATRNYCRHLGGRSEQVLGLVLDGLNQILAEQNAGNLKAWSANRFEWAESTGKFEALAIWASPNGQAILSIKDDVFNHPNSWGNLLGILMIESVETLADELEIERPEVISEIGSSFRERLAIVQLKFQREVARHTLQ